MVEGTYTTYKSLSRAHNVEALASERAWWSFTKGVYLLGSVTSVM